MQISQLHESVVDRQVSPTKNASIDAVHAVQGVFTAVLRQAGREGYRSAESVASGDPASNGSLTESIESTWTNWFEQFGHVRYFDYIQRPTVSPATGASPSSKPTGNEFRDEYTRVLVSAYNSQGFAKPKEFLQKLDDSQLRSVQFVHRLADPIDTATLSEEGALNLLLPPDAAVDADHDGLNAIGKAFTFTFPDSNTPRDVRDAWEAATANLPPEEVMQHVFEIKSSTLLANVKRDATGQVVGFYDPGDAEWVNPMNSIGYSYRAAAQNWLDYLDAFKNQIPLDQYQRDQAFWSRFQALLPTE